MTLFTEYGKRRNEERGQLEIDGPSRYVRLLLIGAAFHERVCLRSTKRMTAKAVSAEDLVAQVYLACRRMNRQGRRSLRATRI